jgi:SpoIID/LytB domain protein
MRKALAAIAALLSLSASGSVALAGQPAVLAAVYQAAPAASMGATADVTVDVTVTNAGDEVWKSFSSPQTSPGAGQVALSYHWYDPQGRTVVWDGIRNPLGRDVAPAASSTVSATVRVPATPGAYFLRFALIKENVAWFAPSQAFAVNVTPAFNATFAQPASTPLITAQTYTLPVTVTNSGTVPWPISGPTPVTLSYHWHDATGSTVVWDGLRTPLAADVMPGQTVTVQARVTSPATSGSYKLTFDLVRENVAWFASLGSAPAPLAIVVAPVTYAAQYGVQVSAASFIGETRSLPVSVTNSGNVPWNAANPVNLSYHVFDAKGNAVVWDGERTVLGDVAIGAAKQVVLTYTSPTKIGDYVLSIDAVREGQAWFSSLGTQPVRLPMRVDSGFGIGYGASTTPNLVTIGARVTLRVDVNNYGPRTLIAGGPNPVRLSYHLMDASGSGVVVWEGTRGALPGDLAPGQSASVQVDVQLPSFVGSYQIAWDLVQEGVAWLSQLGVPQKREPISVQPGVTFYGKGFGHGLGMSQYGAQGMATGAGGLPPKTGEQIATYYYPGTTIGPLPANSPSFVIRVLLSQPSSQGKYSCGGAYYDGNIANLVSAGGFRVLSEGAGNAEIFRASPNVSVQLYAIGGVVQVWNQATATPTKVYEGPGPIVTVPLEPSQPTSFREKGVYRGNFRFTNLGGTLRAINVVSYDDYVRGVVPLEMLTNWHLEAYKAQALAARSYAYSSYRGGSRDYDVSDDQADQCYGGVRMITARGQIETTITNLAVDLTAGKFILYNGTPIRAYFASSNGGYTKAIGCWANNVQVIGGNAQCAPSDPYLTPVPDPWDLSVSQPAPNRNTSWQVTYTSDSIRGAILSYRGVDIGTLLSVDLSNRQPAVVGHVTSVKLVGSLATIDLPADRFLKDNLFLRSTMVRLAPW